MSTTTVEYISDTIDKKRFLQKVYARSRSEPALETVEAQLKSLDYYSMDMYHRNTDEILADLKANMQETQSPAKILRYLDDYVSWIQLDHPNIIVWRGKGKTIKTFVKKKHRNSVSNYFATVRKYVSQVGGIRIHDDDIKMFVTKPKPKGHYEEEDAVPLNSAMAQRIMEETKSKRSKAFYMVMNDTAFRTSEAAKIQEKHIDFTKNPVEIFLPEENSKGKNTSGTRYLRKSTAEYLKQFIRGEPERLIFLRGTLKNFRQTILIQIRTVYNSLGAHEFPEFLELDPETGRHKFNLHSWRKRCATEYAKKNGEAMAHGYIRHTKYLPQYTLKTKDEKIQAFRRAEDDLAIDQVKKTKAAMKEATKNLKEFNAEKDKMLTEQQAKIDAQQGDINLLKEELNELKKQPKPSKKQNSAFVDAILKELVDRGIDLGELKIQ